MGCVRPAVTFPGPFQLPWGERKRGLTPEVGEQGAAVLPEGEVSLETEASVRAWGSGPLRLSECGHLSCSP